MKSVFFFFIGGGRYFGECGIFRVEIFTYSKKARLNIKILLKMVIFFVFWGWCKEISAQWVKNFHTKKMKIPTLLYSIFSTSIFFFLEWVLARRGPLCSKFSKGFAEIVREINWFVQMSNLKISFKNSNVFNQTSWKKVWKNSVIFKIFF